HRSAWRRTYSRRARSGFLDRRRRAQEWRRRPPGYRVLNSLGLVRDPQAADLGSTDDAGTNSLAARDCVATIAVHCRSAGNAARKAMIRADLDVFVRYSSHYCPGEGFKAGAETEGIFVGQLCKTEEYIEEEEGAATGFRVGSERPLRRSRSL